MKNKPDYFDAVWKQSHERWNTLERDPELAGPWRQLFNQIQSPRHVISELLQNADDVKATQALIYIKDDYFIFQHNGEDFQKEDFESLCRFGYSNKRKLHTIGFRGIGFKSTFSLGEKVEVYTPTLQVAFHKKRFTEPIWLADEEYSDSLTTIRVRLNNQKVAESIQEMILSWAQNPISLLFFQNIQTLSLSGTIVHKKTIRNGPVKNSRWISLTSGETSRKILLIQSAPLEVTDEIQQEVREERNDPSFYVPPLQISLIMGLERQQLYEVLPTNVELDLPFSINAPFIQDPARTGIKDPLNSPLNEWLLQNAGELAATCFLNWLRNDKLNIKERARAYELLPHPEIKRTNTISGECNKRVVAAFKDALTVQDVLLTTSGSLSNQQECLGLDAELLNVWQTNVLISKFGNSHRFILAQEVSPQARTKLQQWNLLIKVSSEQIIKSLTEHPPLPNPGLEGIKHLWNYLDVIFNNMAYYKKVNYQKGLMIVPARGRKKLFPPSQVMIPSNKDKQLTKEEFSFLQRHLILINNELYSYIQGLLKKPRNQHEPLDLHVINLFNELGLETTASVENLIQEAANNIFSLPDPNQDGLVIARIIARLNLQVPPGFEYLCVDGNWRSVEQNVLCSDEPQLEDLLPHSFQQHIISDQYEQGLSGVTLSNRLEWKHSNKSQLHKFVVPCQTYKHIYSITGLNNFYRQRGSQFPEQLPLTRSDFLIHDWDFGAELWQHWENLAEQEPQVWTDILRQIAKDWGNGWDKYTRVEVYQRGNTYNHSVNSRNVLPAWVNKLREKPCVPGINSKFHFPAELYVRNERTLALEKIVPFVHPDFDQPDFLPLLRLLGVQEKPSDAEKIVQRLRALSNSSRPPLREILKIYDVLERILPYLPNSQQEFVQKAFTEEKLIFSEEKQWYSSGEIYQENPSQIPGLPVIHPEAVTFSLWKRLQVAKAPTAEDALKWLKSLNSGSAISDEIAKRVSTILRRYPEDVLFTCRHWLNLVQEWCPIEEMQWITEDHNQGLNLFEWVRRKTADFSMLSNPAQFLEQTGFTRLASVLRYKIQNHRIKCDTAQPGWIPSLAKNLLRIQSLKQNAEFSSDGSLDFDNIRQQAERLLQTRLVRVQPLEATPYIDGQQAGYPFEAKGLWNEFELFVLDSPEKLHREIVSAVTAPFKDAAIQKAIADCVDRDESWIQDYFSTYFELAETSEEESLLIDQTEAENNQLAYPEEDVFYPMPIELNEEWFESEAEGDFRINNEASLQRGRRVFTKPADKFYLFIRQEGFHWNDQKTYFNSEVGHKIYKEQAIFPFVQYDSEGYIVSRFRLVEGDLEKGIEIPAEVIDMMQSYSDECLLIIRDDHQFLQYNWTQLSSLLKEGQLVLFPAIYRLKKKGDDLLD